MSWSEEKQIEHLLRLPWTIVRETTPEGDQILRVAEIPSAVGSGSTPQEIERDLWESLRESLRAYLHFKDPVPLPSGAQPAWLNASHFAARMPFILRVPESTSTATAAAWMSPPNKHAA